MTSTSADHFDALINAITPEAYENLRNAVAIGKWPDGRVVSPEQKENCMQAIIAYERKHVPLEERTGYVPPKSHSHCGGEGEISEPEDKPLKWQ